MRVKFRADAALELVHGHAYTPTTGPTLRRLAALAPQRLALMHGPTFVGDGAAQLLALADCFDAQLERTPEQAALTR